MCLHFLTGTVCAVKCDYLPTFFGWQVCLLQDSLQHWILPWATCFDDLLHMLKVDVPVPQEPKVALLEKAMPNYNDDF